MIKKQGFTLIELLAVIVILAIIAVIATPIVLDIIDSTKESSNVRSGEFYLDAVENSIMQYKLNYNKKYEPSYCLIETDGNLYCDFEVKIKVESEGERPDGGSILFSKGKITSSELIYGTEVVRSNEKNELEKVEDFATQTSYKEVYFDVKNGKGCKKSDYNNLNSETGYNGIDAQTDGQNSCLKFYEIKDNGTTVDLFLDHNTTAMVAWNSTGLNTSGPSDVLTQLQNDTKSWAGTLTPTNYSTDMYTVNYSNHKARLITVEEILALTNHTTWKDNVRVNFYFFDTKTTAISETCIEGNTSGCQYGWLYDRTNVVCKATGCLYNASQPTAGYWTASYKKENSKEKLHVDMCGGQLNYGISYRGRLGYACHNNPEHYGVRPVITVSKNNI